MKLIPIDGVIFDIGMVLLKFDFNLTVGKLKSRCRVPEKEIEKLFWETGLIQAYEVGKISTLDFAIGTAQAIQFSGPYEELIEAWSDIFTPNLPMMQRAREWKRQGVSLYFLSNTCESHVDFFTQRYDIFEIFDGGIYSHIEGCAKPEPEIYRGLLGRYQLKPERTLFLDDRLENVEAARRMSIHAIQYIDENQIEAELCGYELPGC